MKIRSSEFLHLASAERAALISQWLETPDDTLWLHDAGEVKRPAQTVFLTPSMRRKGVQ